MSDSNEYNKIRESIFGVDKNNFEATALAVFNYQYQNNKFYRTYCNTIKTNPEEVNQINNGWMATIIQESNKIDFDENTLLLGTINLFNSKDICSASLCGLG